MLTTRTWLIGSLALTLSACAGPVPGDFCEVVPSELHTDAETAAMIVKRDRTLAERMAAVNAAHERWCE